MPMWLLAETEICFDHPTPKDCLVLLYVIQFEQSSGLGSHPIVTYMERNIQKRRVAHVTHHASRLWLWGLLCLPLTCMCLFFG